MKGKLQKVLMMLANGHALNLGGKKATGHVHSGIAMEEVPEFDIPRYSDIKNLKLMHNDLSDQ